LRIDGNDGNFSAESSGKVLGADRAMQSAIADGVKKISKSVKRTTEIQNRER